MALSKQEVSEIVSTVGVKTIDKDATPAGISSTRSRLWQAAKRKGTKVSCAIQADKIVVTVTQG